MEHGTKPKLSVDNNGTLVLPEVQTRHEGIDTVIQGAWLRQYSSTAQMLKHIKSLHTDRSQDTHSPKIHPVSRESLRDCDRHWREHWEKQFGK